MKKLNINGIQVSVHKNGDISRMVRGKVSRTSGGWSSTSGCNTVSIGGKRYMMHRIVAEAFLPDYGNGLRVRHVNGDKLDNRPENLRMMSVTDVARGRRVKGNGATSKYRGVCASAKHGKFLVNIQNSDKRVHIGVFDDEDEAARAWNHAALAAGFPRESLNNIKESV